MVHDPVEQGQIQFIEFISQFIQFQLKSANTSGGSEILILSFVLSSSIGFTYCYCKLEQKLFAVFTVQCVRRIHHLCHMLTVKLFSNVALELACSIHGVAGPLTFEV